MLEQIIGTGSSYPGKILKNSDLTTMVDTTEEWIQSRTGICSRHISEKDTVVTLSIDASRKAIENAGIHPEEIDQIIVATSSAEQIFPCVACEVQAAIGAIHASCFDLNAACSGFLTAYQLAAGELAAGIVKTVLVIGAEVLSNLVDYTDRTTCILFGDGAGAVIMKENREKKLHSSFLLGANGSMGKALTCNSGVHTENQIFQNYIQMDGRAIYKFAVKKVPECIEALLHQTEYTRDCIDYYILHQANVRIIESIAKHLDEPIEKFPMNLKNHGNMSSASIPALIDELNRAGKLKRGMRLLLAGFGAGLTWGAALVEW